MFASIRGLTVELMVRSAGDAEIIRQSNPYHRVAFEAIRDRDAAAARAAIQAHLSIAASTYGEDYDRQPRHDRARALRLIGSGAGLEEFLRTVLPDGSGILTRRRDTDDLRPGAHQEVPAWGERSESIAPHRTEGALKTTPERKPPTGNSPKHATREPGCLALLLLAIPPGWRRCVQTHILDLARSPVCK